MKKGILLIIIVVIYFVSAQAQHTYLPFNTATNHIIDRFDIKGSSLNNDFFHTSTKSYRRKSIAEFANKLYENDSNFSRQDLFNLEYLLNDNFEWAKTDYHYQINQYSKLFTYKKRLCCQPK